MEESKGTIRDAIMECLQTEKYSEAIFIYSKHLDQDRANPERFEVLSLFALWLERFNIEQNIGMMSNFAALFCDQAGFEESYQRACMYIGCVLDKKASF